MLLQVLPSAVVGAEPAFTPLRWLLCRCHFAAGTAGPSVAATADSSGTAGDPSAAGAPAQTQHIARSASNQCVLLKVAVGEASAALFGVHCFLLLPTRIRHFGRLVVLPKE